MARRFLTLALTLILPAGVTFAQEAADLARGPVAPYDQAAQRRAFLTAAGVDSELSSEEFAADQKRDAGFARAFDNWRTLAGYDRNNSGTIDWFEADAYRRDLRTALLTAYDKDSNRRLTGEERDAINRALTQGKVPSVKPQASASSAGTAPDSPRRGPEGRGPGGRSGPGNAGFSPFGGNEQERAKFEAFRADMVKKHDKDGDGELTGEERDAARDDFRNYFRERYIAQNDKDGDGEVSEAERDAARQAQRQAFQKRLLDQYDANNNGEIDESERETMRDEFRKRREEQMRAFIVRRFDKDGDGELNPAEQAEADKAREEYRQRQEERRAQFMERFDKNQNGEIDDEERAAIRDAFRNRGRGRGRGGERNRDRDNRDRSF